MFYLDERPDMASGSRKAEYQKLRLLWVSAFLYLFLALFALHYASATPYPILGLAGTLNMAVIFVFIFAI